MAFNEISNAQIEERLLKGPHEIWSLGQKALEARQAFEEAKEDLSLAYNRAYLKNKAKLVEEKPTVQDLKATTELDIHDNKLALIVAEVNMKKAELDWQQSKDRWDAARSAVKFRVAEMAAEVRHNA